ncbi:MAG TPA: hypothetical protein VEJ84_08160 [Acidimicrobiales bacterium]|nr:hypothetical protein [Acidimicrobiales bacterium]
MTTTDYILDLALGMVLLQVRGRKLTAFSLLLPFAIVVGAATTYLSSVPTAGSDLVLLVGCSVIGAVLGSLCAVFTSVGANPAGVLVSKARPVAAILWVLGVGARLAFQEYVTHGGLTSLGRFSAAHDITSAQAWTAALVLMALAEVVARSGGIGCAGTGPGPTGNSPSGPWPPHCRARMATGELSA